MASPIDGGVVLVTGASSGIGRAIAREVGMRANVLVVVARRAEQLAKLKEELLAARRALVVEVIVCDLSKPEEVDTLVAEVGKRGHEVDVLVNNAGVGLMGAFDRADPAKVRAMLDLNVTSLTMLTLALLPGMVARGRGGILNISSGFGLSALPSFAAYIGTKHFVTGFSDGLHADLAGTGVSVTQVLPGPVKTEFADRIGNFTGRDAPALAEISAERCARVAVRAFDNRRALVVPGVTMKALMLVNGMSPRFTRRIFAGVLGRIARKAELKALKEPNRSEG